MTEQTQATEATADSAEQAPIPAYKGFDRDLKCRGFQFEIGQTYTHKGKVEACAGGFHACEHPLNVFSYYAPATSRFAIVEQSGDLSRHSDDTKVASRTITIKAELDLPGLIRAAIEYTFRRARSVDPDSPASATGYQGAASATGDQGAASATGRYGAASATGYQGAASATGDQGAAIAVGCQGRAMAGETGAIVLAHRNDDGEIVHIRASKVGENGIKAGVWYSLNEDGEFAEAEF